MRIEKTRQEPWRVAMMLVLPIFIFVLAQTVALMVGDFSVKIGMPAAIGNVLASVLYPLLTVLGLSLLCEKCAYEEIEDYRITGFRVRLVWLVTAIVMPLAVSGVFLLMPGEWGRTFLDSAHVWDILTGGVLFYGLAAGIVEEMVFRGVIMRTIENHWNRCAAIFVPSVLFGALHILDGGLSFLSAVQLLVAGSIVGILFSLITYESGTIWCSALVHGIWNVVIIGGIVHIGPASESDAIFNYVLKTKYTILTGGDFGIEASVVSIVVYAMFTLLAIRLLHKKGKEVLG